MNTLHPSAHFLPAERQQANKGLLSSRGRDYGKQPGALRPCVIVRCCVPTQDQGSLSSSLRNEEQNSPASSVHEEQSSPASSRSSPAPPRKSPSSFSVETTDWIASSLTRRFGLGAGLAWVGFLAFGVISEQIKTRREVYLEEQGTRDVQDVKEVVLGSNVRYVDLRVGGGALPLDGDLVLVDLVGRVLDSGETFVDTESGSKKRPIALVFGRRPYVGGMCAGLEEAMRTMHVGGKRRVVVPAAMGFGASGVDLGDGAVIPSNATLEYTVTLLKSSIAPS